MVCYPNYETVKVSTVLSLPIYHNAQLMCIADEHSTNCPQQSQSRWWSLCFNKMSNLDKNTHKNLQIGVKNCFFFSKTIVNLLFSMFANTFKIVISFESFNWHTDPAIAPRRLCWESNVILFFFLFFSSQFYFLNMTKITNLQKCFVFMI